MGPLLAWDIQEEEHTGKWCKLIKFGHTGLETLLINLSGGIQKASKFMNKLLRGKVRDETWTWEPLEQG